MSQYRIRCDERGFVVERQDVEAWWMVVDPCRTAEEAGRRLDAELAMAAATAPVDADVLRLTRELVQHATHPWGETKFPTHPKPSVNWFSGLRTMAFELQRLIGAPSAPAALAGVPDHTILTISGQYFSFENPAESQFGIEDIAHALGNMCRFNGHCREFYSVAQHSVLLSEIVPPADALAGLLHDAAEAFIGDVTKPLKTMLPDYKAIESRVESAVFQRFGLSPDLPPSIKHADLVMLATEQRDLMRIGDGHLWTTLTGVEPVAARILPWSSKDAKALFLERFQELQHRISEDDISRARAFAGGGA